MQAIQSALRRYPNRWLRQTAAVCFTYNPEFTLGRMLVRCVFYLCRGLLDIDLALITKHQAGTHDCCVSKSCASQRNSTSYKSLAAARSVYKFKVWHARHLKDIFYTTCQRPVRRSVKRFTDQGKIFLGRNRVTMLTRTPRAHSRRRIWAVDRNFEPQRLRHDAVFGFQFPFYGTAVATLRAIETHTTFSAFRHSGLPDR